MGKGWVIGWLAAQTIDHEAWVLGIALCPIVGHLFPVFLKFQGGKGVATSAGVFLALAPLAVRPEHQGKGVGSALTKAGIRACTARGLAAEFVLAALVSMNWLFVLRVLPSDRACLDL